ncbi:MAG: hypothetical protein AAFQ51_00305 [Pseudomonadota bacterium]
MTLDGLYFRTKDNGAAVYRIDTENRHRRLDMIQIAVVTVRNGEIKPHGQQVPTEAERAEMLAWIEARRALLARREREDIDLLIEALHKGAQWAQAKASDEDIRAKSPALFMAMHDLRDTLVRRNGDLLKGDD